MIGRFLIVLLTVAVAGCAHSAPDSGDGEPLLGAPLPPESLGHDLSLSQIVTSEHNGERRSLRVEVEVTAERLVMVGLSHIGAPLFTLELDPAGLRTSTATAEPLPFDPLHILSDFQLAHWPREVIAEALARNGYRLGPGPQASGRYVYGANERLLMRIEYPESSGGDLLIQHYDLPYKLIIRTVERKEGK